MGFCFFVFFAAFFTLGFSFSGLWGVLSAPRSAASKRSWLSFALYCSLSLATMGTPMNVPRMLKLRPHPNFRDELIQDSERSNADNLRINIAQLHDRATDFWSGKALFEFCLFRTNTNYRRTFERWQILAARDCVMSIYHFGRIIEGIDISLGSCPSLRDIIDTTAKRKARKRFEKYFPFYITIRHALAHSAERSNTEASITRHAKQGPIDLSGTGAAKLFNAAAAACVEVLMSDSIMGDKFMSMWEGEVVTCDINEASGKFLDEIVDEFWSAFSAVIVSNPTAPPHTGPSGPPAPQT